jgi:hypothetical protein
MAIAFRRRRQPTNTVRSTLAHRPRLWHLDSLGRGQYVVLSAVLLVSALEDAEGGARVLADGIVAQVLDNRYIWPLFEIRHIEHFLSLRKFLIQNASNILPQWRQQVPHHLMRAPSPYPLHRSL